MALPALTDAHTRVIVRSHERCSALGLSRIERPDHAPLGRPDLGLVRERNRRLHTHAAPVMEMLVEQIAGTESMVVLCDSSGTIIHSIGDADFLSRASQVALQPGVNWSEPAKGTNAIGTALIEEQPTLVHAGEHYMHANHFLTCSATPILDPRGNILGVLDVTGDQRSYHPHTMALVKLSARLIENHWLSDDHHDALRLHFHGRVPYLGTLMEGILAVSPDGRIVGANRGALEQLGQSGAALRRHTLASLFGTTVGALVDRFRQPVATPLVLRAPNGRSFHVQAHFSWPAWNGRAEVPPAPAPAPLPSTSASASALARLQTGDARFDALVDRARRVLDRDIPVLLLGEPGTGKERLARALHADSARARLPFVAVHGGALAEVGSEGWLPSWHQARGGTLYIDALDELPPRLQAGLLRQLQGHAQAAGEDPVAPALIAAAPADLAARAQAGAFREDLLRQLSGLTLTLPPLRERGDFAALAQSMLDATRASPPLQLGAEALAWLQAQPWPGNLRQLDSTLRVAAALAGDARVITPEHLHADALAAKPDPAGPASRSLGEVELQTIRDTVAAAGGNISEAAKRLGISRNTIYRKLRWKAAAPA